MKKVYFKLIVMLAALLLSASVVIMSSYAWLVLAGNPAVTGIQVAIGGGNTILMAPNIRTTGGDGVVYNYPGHFSDKMNFGHQEGYAYLRSLGNLAPVSTSNGVDWFIPTYYSGNDPEVQSGRVPSGLLKDVSQFIQDSELSYANLDLENEEDLEKNRKGSYIYLDFWVVSPGGDYTLRVSSGSGTTDGGSFVVDLLQPKKSGDGYSLEKPMGSASGAVRIGFLANDLQLVDNTMLEYRKSRYCNDQYTSLRGLYQEPDSGTAYLESNRFIIYEPNGDHHPSEPELEGNYMITKPLGLENGVIAEQDIRNKLTVQRKSLWADSDVGTGTAIEQRFQVALKSWEGKNLSVGEITERFYGAVLQGQISPYVNKGQFLASTRNLYTYAADGSASAYEMTEYLKNAGATEDENTYIIRLERNVPQRLRMFIWLEGQDMDCVDSVNSARFAVNIELAGSDLT